MARLEPPTPRFSSCRVLTRKLLDSYRLEASFAYPSTQLSRRAPRADARKGRPPGVCIVLAQTFASPGRTGSLGGGSSHGARVVPNRRSLNLVQDARFLDQGGQHGRPMSGGSIHAGRAVAPSTRSADGTATDGQDRSTPVERRAVWRQPIAIARIDTARSTRWGRRSTIKTWPAPRSIAESAAPTARALIAV